MSRTRVVWYLCLLSSATLAANLNVSELQNSGHNAPHFFDLLIREAHNSKRVVCHFKLGRVIHIRQSDRAVGQEAVALDVLKQ